MFQNTTRWRCARQRQGLRSRLDRGSDLLPRPSGSPDASSTSGAREPASARSSAVAGRGRRAWRLARSLADRAARSLLSARAHLPRPLLVTFLIGRMIPIDPVLAIVGERRQPRRYARVRAGARPRPAAPRAVLPSICEGAHGDFGKSILTAQPGAATTSPQVFPATLELATVATLIGVVLGVPPGVLAATARAAGPTSWSASSAWSAIPCRCSGWASSAARLLRQARLGRRAGPARCLLRRHRRRRSPAWSS